MAVRVDAADAGHGRQVGRGAGEGGVDRDGGEVAQLVERAELDQPAGAQDGHPVAQGLDLAQDVRGQEDGLAAVFASCTQSRKTCSMSGSSPEVGSSRISRSARVISAAISTTFWRLPFE